MTSTPKFTKNQKRIAHVAEVSKKRPTRCVSCWILRVWCNSPINVYRVCLERPLEAAFALFLRANLPPFDRNGCWKEARKTMEGRVVPEREELQRRLAATIPISRST